MRLGERECLECYQYMNVELILLLLPDCPKENLTLNLALNLV
jgi:hypothetical protein